MEPKTTKTVIFKMNEEQFIQLKIAAILTKRTMSEFIRLCIQEKIKSLKNI
jgi:hypothetical protein